MNKSNKMKLKIFKNLQKMNKLVTLMIKSITKISNNNKSKKKILINKLNQI